VKIEARELVCFELGSQDDDPEVTLVWMKKYSDPPISFLTNRMGEWPPRSRPRYFDVVLHPERMRFNLSFKRTHRPSPSNSSLTLHESQAQFDSWDLKLCWNHPD
jgi:hypothetical protein